MLPLANNTYLSILTVAAPEISKSPIVDLSWQFAATMAILGVSPIWITGSPIADSNWRIADLERKAEFAAGHQAVLYAQQSQLQVTGGVSEINSFGMLKFQEGPGGAVVAFYAPASLFIALIANLEEERTAARITAIERGRATAQYMKEATPDQLRGTFQELLDEGEERIYKPVVKIKSDAARRANAEVMAAQADLGRTWGTSATPSLVAFTNAPTSMSATKSTAYEAAAKNLVNAIASHWGKPLSSKAVVNSFWNLALMYVNNSNPPAQPTMTAPVIRHQAVNVTANLGTNAFTRLAELRRRERDNAATATTGAAPAASSNIRAGFLSDVADVIF